jgi:hexosaminidase
MRFFALLIVLSCLSCAQEKSTKYIQTQEIQLSPPRVTSTAAIIDTTVRVHAILGEADATIFYTTDGSVPTERSTRYEHAFSVEHPGTYSFKAFHSDWVASDVQVLKLYAKGLVPKTFTMYTQPSDTYPGVGVYPLINGQKASSNFNDEQWTGFDTHAFAKADFEKGTFIKTLTIGYLIDPKSWIFPPDKLRFVINERDTLDYQVPALTDKEGIVVDDFRMMINREVHSISVEIANVPVLPEWHAGAGNKAWLFLDEWIFNE